jgi:hypothetical protein
MSAFLYFSRDKRREIKENNPELKNTEISKILGEMWRNASDEEKRPHVEHERDEREKYKIAIAEWREEHEKKLEQQRKQQAEHVAYVQRFYGVDQEGEDERAQSHSVEAPAAPQAGYGGYPPASYPYSPYPMYRKYSLAVIIG